MKKFIAFLIVVNFAFFGHAARVKQVARKMAAVSQESDKVAKRKRETIAVKKSEFLASLGIDNQNGLFANKLFKKGEVIAWYTGTIYYSIYELTKYRFSKQVSKRKEFSYFIEVVDPIDGEHLFWIDAYNPNPARMCAASIANHLPDKLANAHFISKQNRDAPHGIGIALVAKKVIKIGEEITVNYGRAFEETLQQNCMPYLDYLRVNHPSAVIEPEDNVDETKHPLYLFITITPSIIREIDKTKNMLMSPLDSILRDLALLPKSLQEAIEFHDTVDDLIKGYIEISHDALARRSLTPIMTTRIAKRLAFCFYCKSIILLGFQLHDSTEHPSKHNYLTMRFEALEQCHKYASEIIELDSSDYVFKELDAHVYSTEVAQYNAGSTEINFDEILKSDQNLFVDDGKSCEDLADAILEEDSYRYKLHIEKKQHREFATNIRNHISYLRGSKYSACHKDRNELAQELWPRFCER